MSQPIFMSQSFYFSVRDHGSAWAGFGDDDGNRDHQNMPIDEIARGIRDGLVLSSYSSVTNKFNIIGFDACLMNEYTVLESLSPLCDYFIGSEDNEPGIGWDWR